MSKQKVKSGDKNEILLFPNNNNNNNNNDHDDENKKTSLLQRLQDQLQIFIPDNKQFQQKSSITKTFTLFLRFKQVLTLLIIISTSLQVSSIATTRLSHSRNIIRFLNYYIIQHTDMGFYWMGKYSLNYPIQQYYTMGQVNQFLKRLNDIMFNVDDYVYGNIDIAKFYTQENKIIVQQKSTGIIQQYVYKVQDGFTQPFNIDNITSIRQCILQSQQVKITFLPFNISQLHTWQLTISITKFSQSSIIIRMYAYQLIRNFYQYHIITFILGLILITILVLQYLHEKQSYIHNIPEYMLSIFLVYTFILSLNQEIDVSWITILDGIQCCIAWVLLLKFLQKQHDYHISFLLKQSYILVGRLFVSFGPIFIAFALFAYIIFCRQAWQFSDFRRAFLNLFYICYYNMTYESFVVTSRTNPISMIFFFVFVILFTICVYSGMLVSVFCSYVWNKRQNKIKNDIINNLKIQCSSCDYKYKYIDCLKLIKQPNNRLSLKTSFILQIDFKNLQEKSKYKQVLTNKINNLTQKIIKLIEQQKKLTVKNQMRNIVKYVNQQYFQKERNQINKFLQEIIENQKKINQSNNSKLNDGKLHEN